MNKSTLVNLPYISCCATLPKDLINRDALINQIETILSNHDLLFIEGFEGLGKTTLLLDFVNQNPYTAISHFVNINHKYTYSSQHLINNLYNQIYFICNGIECDSDIRFDLRSLNTIQGDLLKQIRNLSHKDKLLFFIFDGFEQVMGSDIKLLSSIFETLPIGKAKFIITGSPDNFKDIFNYQQVKYKPIPIPNFGITETKCYFSDLSTDESEIHEVHKIAEKGNPSLLKDIKLICNELGSIESFLNESYLKGKNDFLCKLWNKTDSNNKTQIEILSFIAFSDIQLNIQILSNILYILEDEVVENISNLSFINYDPPNIEYHSNAIKKYAEAKLSEYKDITTKKLIEYCEKNQDLDISSRYNLPMLYKKIKDWEKLTKYYSIEAFTHYLKSYQTMGNINVLLSDGLDASRHSSENFDEARLRFALHKSSAAELESNLILESEIEARNAIGEYDVSQKLANSTLLKEERLKLLALIAKDQKVKNDFVSENLQDQIKSLYESINFEVNSKIGFEISTLLIYSNFQLAIELVEKITDYSINSSALDQAYSYLTLFANEINKETDSQVIDIDIISSKIEDNEIKNFTEAFRYLSEEYNASQMLSKIKKMPRFNQKLFLIRNWIISSNNHNDPNMSSIIFYVLDEIVKVSSENTPNATTLSEIALPLPKIKDKKIVDQLILLFDANKDTINKPTKDYVKLQLLIASALIDHDFEQAKDRIFDIFIFVDDLTDLSIKTDCLCLIWVWLLQNDKDHVIESSISNCTEIREQIEKNVDDLLANTALHFKMIESLIVTIVTIEPNFIFTTIGKLNTQRRRNYAYKYAAINYVRQVDFIDLDNSILLSFFNQINDKTFKDDILIEVVEKFDNSEIDVSSFISKLIYLKAHFFSISNNQNKCYSLVHFITTLMKYRTSNSDLIDELFIELMKTWESVHVISHKIVIAFLIVRDLKKNSNEESTKYLKLALDLKTQEQFSTDIINNTHNNSIILSIIAFCGVALIKADLSEEFQQIEDAIDSISSIGDKIVLWSEFCFRLLSIGKKDLFNKVLEVNLNALLHGLVNDISDFYFESIVTEISPVIYSYNQGIYFSDYYSKLSLTKKDKAIANICDFIITGLPTSINASKLNKLQKLDYTKLKELCLLIEKLNNDNLIWVFIGKIVNQYLHNRSNIAKEQKNNLILFLNKVIDEKLPYDNGITHIGYKILSKAEILLMDVYSPQKWNKLIDKVSLIPNCSDQSLCYIILAEKLNKVCKNKKEVIKLVDQSFEKIKDIPSFYDKNNRIENNLQKCFKLDRGKFTKYIKLVFTELLSSDESDNHAIRNLIDIAHKCDKDLAEKFVSLLDKDEARLKLQKQLRQKYESKIKIDNAKNKLSNLSDLNEEQSINLFNNNLEELLNQTRVSKNLSETFEILDKASTISLSDSFSAYYFFIQNSINRFQLNTRNPENLIKIFNATIENIKFVQILSCVSLEQLKALNLKSKNDSKNINPIFEVGQRELAINYLKGWFSENLKDRIFIIDPYFSIDDLQLLQIIQEINCQSEVFILTSKENRTNQYINLDTNKSNNKEKYLEKWSEISTEPPVNCTIKIVWNKENMKSPFHDRYIITENPDKGITMGTSFNGLGSKLSQFTVMSNAALEEVKYKIIENILFKEVRLIGDSHLRYERIYLDPDEYN